MVKSLINAVKKPQDIEGERLMVNTHWGPALVPTDSGGRVRRQLTLNYKRICKEVTKLVNTKGQGSQTRLLLPRTWTLVSTEALKQRS